MHLTQWINSYVPDCTVRCQGHNTSRCYSHSVTNLWYFFMDFISIILIFWILTKCHSKIPEIVLSINEWECLKMCIKHEMAAKIKNKIEDN